jgi:hypothetical protein
MRTVFVSVHSPAVGPLTWGHVADALAVRQHESVIPRFLRWLTRMHLLARVVDIVDAAMSRLDQGQCVLLVAQRRPVMPLLVRHAVRPVRCCLFVDARASRSSPPDASRADPAAGLPARQGDRWAAPAVDRVVGGGRLATVPRRRNAGGGERGRTSAAVRVLRTVSPRSHRLGRRRACG